MDSGNIFHSIPKDLPNEWIEVLCQNANVRIERIVSQGHKSAHNFWYEQKEAEWVILLEGEASIRYEDGREHNLYKGDYLFLPAYQKHQVSYTSSTPKAIWLAIFIL